MTARRPPKLFHNIFRWYCHPKMLKHIEGDLLELYDERVEKNGKLKADLRFVLDVLLLFRPGIIRPAEGHQRINTYGMYKSYLKIGWRNLIRNQSYSIINIGGLALGISVALLIGIWIHDELTFNHNYENYASIGRLVRHVDVNGETLTRSHLPNTIGEELVRKYGNNFQSVVMAYPVEEYFLTYGEMKLPLRGEFMESEGTELFTLSMVKGSRDGLRDMHSIMLSETTAKILFGDEEPLNKLLTINNSMEAKVTGVYKDLPHNDQFHDVRFFAPLELLMSYEPWMKEPSYSTNFLNIYIQLAQNINFETASSRTKDAILKNVQADKQYVAMNPQIEIQPMQRWHLYAEWKNGLNTGGLIQLVLLFGIVGIFVLSLACINFINLSTVRSEKRTKEVGIRKSIGSARIQLINQFLTESLLVVVAAFIIALFLVLGSIGWFNELAGKQIAVPYFNFYFWCISLVFIVVVSLVAGSYPAFYLSSFNPARVLKGIQVGHWASRPRQIMVIVQFSVSVCLIIGTIMVHRQIDFAKDRAVGYNRDGLVMIQMTSPDFAGKYDLLRNELLNSGAVINMAESSSPPTDIWSSNSGFDWEGKNPALEPVFATLTVTPDYGETVGWTFLQGRDFLRDHASDSAGLVINEAAAKVIGLENPVGQIIRWNTWRSQYNQFQVIGVIRDMVMGSPYASTTPAVYFLSKESHHFINIKINPELSANEALIKVENVFKKVLPSVPFDYKFADQEFASKFAVEERIGKLSTLFSGLAILISSIGLFGLASYVAEQRSKEIGIRKIVGASLVSLLMLLSKDFIRLVLIACFVAVPVAYYFLSEWLNNYEYRTELSWWVFGLTCFVAIVVALATVSYQAIKTSSANPVKSLRSE